MKAKKKFGQNFLVDPYFINQIIKEINPKESDEIVEIGPGQGAITYPILKKIKHVSVIEIDPDMIEVLKNKIDDKNEVEFEIAKSQMDDEYDLRKDNLGKIQADKFKQLEKLIIPLLIKLAKSPEAYIHWPNRAEVIEAQLKKIVAITRA